MPCDEDRENRDTRQGILLKIIRILCRAGFFIFIMLSLGCQVTLLCRWTKTLQLPVIYDKIIEDNEGN